MKKTGYEPLFTLKPAASNVWVVDGPTISFYGMPFPTRMTVIRLDDGDLFVHSPIQLTDELKESVQKLGPVRVLVAPNWIHYAYVPQWQEAFPDATTWAAPGVSERAESRGMEIVFDHELGAEPAPELAGEIDSLLVEGSSIHHEVVFFHHPSRTLILTDLIENFEPSKMPLWTRPLIFLAGVRDPDGKAPIDMRFSFRKNREQLQKAVQHMLDWEPERVILAHGRWYKENGTEELRRAFRWAFS